MNRRLWPLLALWSPAMSHADCAHDNAQIKQVLPGPALAARNVLFKELCANGASLIDVTDPGLSARFVPASFEKDNILQFYDGVDYPRELKTTLLLAFLIDVDGSVSHATMLVGSGSKAVDDQALSLWSEVKLRTAASNDGKPVRTLVYWKMNPATAKPAS
jgi:hypothetical protein